MTADANKTIAVIGAGSWGTALALQFARRGQPVRLWGRDRAQLAGMREARVNARYLPGAAFPGNLEAFVELEDCLDGARDILVAVPSHGFRETLEAIRPLLANGARVCWATKGFDPGSGELLSHVATGRLPGSDLAVVSGPTFARP